MSNEMGFESLDVWKRSCSLAVFVYQSLEQKRDFGLRIAQGSAADTSHPGVYRPQD